MNDLSLAGPLVGFGCTLILFGLVFIMLDRKAYYARWVPGSFMLVGALIIVSGSGLEVWNATRATPVATGEYVAPPISPPLVTYTATCTDGSAPWTDQDGRESCLTREQSEERAMWRANVMEAWRKQQAEGYRIDCGSTLMFSLCIVIPPEEEK